MSKGRFVLSSDKLEKRFREDIGKRYGAEKGAITKAIDEAVRDWCEKVETMVE